MLYVYFPIFDEGLPELNKLHAVARLGARLATNDEKVLAHCGMGFGMPKSRSPSKSITAVMP